MWKSASKPIALSALYKVFDRKLPSLFKELNVLRAITNSPPDLVGYVHMNYK